MNIIQCIQKIFLFCPFCKPRTGKYGLFKYPYNVRRNTSYVDDSRNFLFCCKECHKQDDDEMADTWKNVSGYTYIEK